jgi:hypothetical protein
MWNTIEIKALIQTHDRQCAVDGAITMINPYYFLLANFFLKLPEVNLLKIAVVTKFSVITLTKLKQCPIQHAPSIYLRLYIPLLDFLFPIQSR